MVHKNQTEPKRVRKKEKTVTRNLTICFRMNISQAEFVQHLHSTLGNEKIRKQTKNKNKNNCPPVPDVVGFVCGVPVCVASK